MTKGTNSDLQKTTWKTCPLLHSTTHTCPGYLIHNYLIKFVSDLRQVSGFLQLLWLPSPIKLTVMI